MAGNKVAHYLQEHLIGEVMTSADARKYFSTDSSVVSVEPSIIVYPRNENDVRKTARFTWQLAERGRVVPITARGSGTDQNGAALGAGIVMVFPAHMNRIVELDDKSGELVVEPGINYGKLQQTLITHGRFLPPYPASMEFSTVGGAVANNATGEKSVKYGDTKVFVKSLRVVLANGELIETKPLSKRELNKKLGLSTFEGEIYRSLDALLEENEKTIEDLKLNVTENSAGYDLSSIKTKAGFDLTPLFVGSQGTLGIITEVVLDTMPYSPDTTLMVGTFESVASAGQAIMDLRGMPNMPSFIEMIDDSLLDQIERINPNQLKGIVSRPFAKVTLFIEFDDADHSQKRLTKKASKILDKYASEWKSAGPDEENAQAKLRKLRQATATVISHSAGGSRAVPFINDGIVPPERFADFLDGIHDILNRHHIKAGAWGHAGDGNIGTWPFFDLAQVGDRQTLFKLYDEYYELVSNLGGSSAGASGDGRLKAPLVAKVYGQEVEALFGKLKQIFDPYGILNPGVKTGVSLADVKSLLRHEYSLGPWYEHMPRL